MNLENNETNENEEIKSNSEKDRYEIWRENIIKEFSKNE